ncbi:MAG: flagellar hook-basal body complex protein [Pirellulales bacterium]
MGLTSSLSTALTGLNAAESQIDVLGNNLANSQTVGFKSSDVIFGTQFLQTLSLGAAPSADNGGTNPRQTGLGVQVAAITPKFTQGTIQISSSSSDLAIQGDGFFVVEGSAQERLYTRNGIFKLNSENELVTSTGNRLLGYGVDEQFNIQTTSLVPLTIPLGSEAVAKATGEVSMEGTLTPSGDVADTAEVLQSAVLGDSSIPRPDSTNLGVAGAVNTNGSSVTVAHNQGGGILAEGAVYQYKFAYVDDSGKETIASNSLSVTIPAGNSLADNTVTLNNLPPAAGGYTQVAVYRTTAGGNQFFKLATATAGGSYVDTGSVPLSSQQLDTSTLNGNYSYMITYYKAGEPESRPSALAGPQNIVNGRIHLTNFPTIPTPPASGGFPAYDSMRIYRNTAADQNTFYLVDTIPAGVDYTDSKTDAAISNLNLSGNKKVNLDGPGVTSNTLLVNVVKRDGLNYENAFTTGSLSFTARKGGRNLEAKGFTVTNTSTVQDLINFMQQAMGIQSANGDSVNPIPSSKNNITGETGDLLPGAYIKDGQLRFVSNNGEDNSISIDLTSFRLTDASGTVTTPNLAFGSVQSAKGQSAVADFIAYDSLGLPIRTRVTAVLQEKTDTETIYRWFADSADNSPATGANIGVGTGLIKFDGNGNFVSASNTRVAVDRTGLPSVSPLQFDIDFTSVSGLATATPTLAAARQDGSPPGKLTSYVVGEDGSIRGVFSNGISRDLGQVRLARFTNPQGLEQRGQNMYAQGINTGLPIEGKPGENGIGGVVAGARELSNTDIGGDLVNLVLASTQYRSNARVITATQQLFDELLNIRR